MIAAARVRSVVSAFAVALLLGLVTFGVFVSPASAESRRVLALAADITPEQRQSMMEYFGVAQGEVDIIVVSNDDERAHLSGYVPLEQIGDTTISCAYVRPTDSGGIQVKTANMTYVTSNMIAMVLLTYGVENCEVLVAAPFPVSGTGALTGIMMAYETSTGEELDPARAGLAMQEIVTMERVSDAIGQDEATLMMAEIKPPSWVVASPIARRRSKSSTTSFALRRKPWPCVPCRQARPRRRPLGRRSSPCCATMAATSRRSASSTRT